MARLVHLLGGMNRDVYIVVPAYGEAPAIRETISALLLLGHEIVVVDDGSLDGTYEAVAPYPVHLVRHAVNLGQGAALQTGTTYAAARGARAVVHFDADGQHAPVSVPALLAPLLAGEADVVLGSRFLDPAHAAMVPPGRRMLLRGGRVVHGLTTGLWLSDAHNGLRALSGPVARELRLRQDRMAHASEIIAFIRRRGLRWVEVPTPVSYGRYAREKGQSALGSVDVAFDLLLRRVFG